MIDDQEISSWKRDQIYCDSPDKVFQMFVEKQFSVEQSLRVLEKARKTIVRSMSSVRWGSVLTCDPSQNVGGSWYPSHVIAEEVKRREETP